jgi:hypothetical protein
VNFESKTRCTKVTGKLLPRAWFSAWATTHVSWGGSWLVTGSLAVFSRSQRPSRSNLGSPSESRPFFEKKSHCHRDAACCLRNSSQVPSSRLGPGWGHWRSCGHLLPRLGGRLVVVTRHSPATVAIALVQKNCCRARLVLHRRPRLPNGTSRFLAAIRANGRRRIDDIRKQCAKEEHCGIEPKGAIPVGPVSHRDSQNASVCEGST